MLARNSGSVVSSKEDYGIIHKVPVGDTPYVRAKQVQLVEKDPEAAIALFWAAINAGDRVESALKDMAIVMKQLGRPLEAIEAIKSFRHRCSLQAQESLDNVLLDLYKKCGRVDEQIVVLKEKLRLIQHGLVFNGNPTKTARSHGKKFQLSIKQETSRLLSNLGWAYMQQLNYTAAELVYRKAQYFDADANKACNLGVCLMKQGKTEEAAAVLEGVSSMDKQDQRSLDRAKHLLKEIHSIRSLTSPSGSTSSTGSDRDELLSSPTNLKKLFSGDDEFLAWEREDGFKWAAEIDYKVARKRHRRLPVFEEITPLHGPSD